MTIFLTSSPTGPLDHSRHVEGLDEKNCLIENLRACWESNARCLLIAANPSVHEMNEGMRAAFRNGAEMAGLSISAFDLWDDRTEDFSREKLHSYNVVFLGGGHVPTQNEFFRQIHLREHIRDFSGLVIGVSAGTMNSADTVYAQPELPGESLDPAYVRYPKGLGLTKTMILPHFQMIRKQELDGRRVIEDITFEDSFGKKFLALPDGSYLLIQDGRETVWGEAYEIADGRIRKICEEGEQWKLN